MDIVQYIMFLGKNQDYRKPLSVKLEMDGIIQEIEVHSTLNSHLKKIIIEEAKQSVDLKEAMLKDKKARIKTSWRCIYGNRRVFKHGIIGVLYDPKCLSENGLKVVVINSSSDLINKSLDKIYCCYQIKKDSSDNQQKT